MHGATDFRDFTQTEGQPKSKYAKDLASRLLFRHNAKRSTW